MMASFNAIALLATQLCKGAWMQAHGISALTLAIVATHFGVPLITISRLERGHQRNDTLANNYRQWLTAA